MKSLVKTTLCGLVLMAMTNIACADVKVGVVDVRAVLQKIPQMTTLKTQLQNQFKPREEKIVAAQKALQAEVDKLNKDAAVLSQADQNKLRDKIDADKASLQSQITSFQRDLNTAQNKDMQTVLKQVSDTINQIGKDGKYSFVLQTDATAYIDNSLDITNQVVKTLSDKK